MIQVFPVFKYVLVYTPFKSSNNHDRIVQDYVVAKTGKFLSGDNQLQIHTRQAEFQEEEGMLPIKLYYPKNIHWRIQAGR